ncbi:WD repeat-containing protein 37-like isoform X2 [Amphibalanus amphitrite]|uniref:WD repeat-containing protein 37-like isoform X2 n=2 Tax=Amphibalanus amphitrite TaxID=1232801 RepID=UPI001C9264B6|nr:WD repeat-containing protein 37-like isoform X2 [Amphibalanus amphitrite]
MPVSCSCRESAPSTLGSFSTPEPRHSGTARPQKSGKLAPPQSVAEWLEIILLEPIRCCEPAELLSGGAMPLDLPHSAAPAASKTPRSLKISMPRMRHHEPEQPAVSGSHGRADADQEPSPLPLRLRSRLNDLFFQIEKEFEAVCSENAALHKELELLQEKPDRETGDRCDDTDGAVKSKQKLMSHAAQKLKPAYKLKQQTSKIVSSFKAASVVCALVREYRGHKDGVWEVSAGRPGQHVVGTASADHTACVWSVDSGRCLLQYQGHEGSVNSVRFHPTRDLVLTGSGDQTAHVWQAAVNIDSGRAMSSEEEVDPSDMYDDMAAPAEGSNVLRTPILELTGHSGVVIAADWLAGAEQVVTASWDRTAQLFDVNTGESLNTLAGHDQELTHVSAHPSHKFVVTSSKDFTFRLWDFREPIPCVSVFQGHTDAVTSAVFSREDKVVSGSDDRSCKVWDLKNMRSPLATIRGDAAVNRLDVSSANVIAVPFDNRHIRLYDMNGQRLARLPRSNRLGHRRMVCSVAWSDDLSSGRPNLFSSGFDNTAIGWLITPPKDSKD